MDTNNQNQITESPEELELEKEVQVEVKDDELKAKIAEDLGMDPEEDKELIEKVFAREKVNREKLSGAIKQKINWRTKAQQTSDPNKDKKDGDKPNEGGDKVTLTPEELDRRFEEKLAERDLKDLALPEEVEKEVKDLAKLKGISVKEAVKLPYIVAKLDEIKKDEAAKNASPKRDSKGSFKVSDLDFSKPLNPADFDLNSEEGRKAWKEARQGRDKYLAEHS